MPPSGRISYSVDLESVSGTSSASQTVSFGQPGDLGRLGERLAVVDDAVAEEVHDGRC